MVIAALSVKATPEDVRNTAMLELLRSSATSPQRRPRPKTWRRPSEAERDAVTALTALTASMKATSEDVAKVLLGGQVLPADDSASMKATSEDVAKLNAEKAYTRGSGPQ